MNLEALALEVRPRTPWEAMDVAIRLVVKHWQILFYSWMVTVFPLVLLINIVLLEDYSIWAFFLVWYLKPLYDRVPLFVLSRVIFSDQVSVKEVLHAIPSFFKTGIVQALTLERLDSGRAFWLPLRQLEKLTGKRRKRRITSLSRNAKNRENMLFFLCFNLESLIALGLMGFVLMLLPEDTATQSFKTLFMQEEPSLLHNSLQMVLYFFVMMMVESLYVAGGFVLYLNRRIILEGWDIELAFRRLTKRQKRKPIYISAIMMLCSSLVFMAINLPQNAYALVDTNNDYLPAVNPVPLAGNQSKEVIQEVMKAPVFNRKQEIEYPKYTGDFSLRNKNNPEDTLWLVDALETVGKVLARIFELGLWLILLIALFLLIKYRQHLHFGWAKKTVPLIVKPKTLFGLDLREESFPDDVATSALTLYQEKHYREAMALLYRATLAYLVQHYHFDLKTGATEGDCLYWVTQTLADSEQISYFSTLAQAWQLTAYAHQCISEKEMRWLCDNWSTYYVMPPVTDNDSDNSTQVKHHE